MYGRVQSWDAYSGHRDRDIAKWARTSQAMIATFYDQTHPQLSVERIVGFRKHPSGKDNPNALAEAAGD